MDNLPWQEKGKPSTVLIYRKQRTSKKYYAIVTDIHPDVLINGRATKPIVDHKYEIVELGIGIGFWDKWSKQYAIKKPQIIAK